MGRLLSIKDTASYLNVSQDTLRKWDKADKLKPLKTAGGHRRYRHSKIELCNFVRWMKFSSFCAERNLINLIIAITTLSTLIIAISSSLLFKLKSVIIA